MKKFKTGDPTPNLVNFLKRMQLLGYEFLTNVVVNTDQKSVELFACELHCSIPCEIGKNGFVLHEDSKVGDGKTPICRTRVRHIDMPISGINDPDSAVMTKTTESKINLGPCFVCLYITNTSGTEEIRGIGFHGSEDDTKGLIPTDGCIRLYNADLYLIRKLFFKNLNVEIL